MMSFRSEIVDALDPFETALHQILSEGGRAGGACHCLSDAACAGSRMPPECLLALALDLIFFLRILSSSAKVGGWGTHMTWATSSST